MWKFLQILCTALAFYGGYKTSLSHTAAHPPRVHCPVPGDKGAKGLMSLRGQHGAVSIQQSSAEAQPCEALESHTTAATTASAAAAASSSTHKKEGDKKSICDLGNSDKDKQEAAQILSRRTYLHAWKGDIAAGAFAHLHNPASPAKYSLVLTASNSWEADTQWALPAAAAAAAAAGGSASTMIGANNVNISHADAELFKDPYFSHECKSLYLTRTGSRQSQPNKCVAVARVKPGYESPTQSSHRIGYTALLTNQYQADFTKDKAIIEENMLLPPLLKDLQNLKTALLKKLGPPIDASTGKRRTAIVMVANEGVMDLVLNWACSSEAAGVSLDDVVVFVGTEDSAAAVENMGAHAMYSSALGSMPKKAAGGYLDNTFSRMMWFKTTSVYLAMYSGFHVLFQDADLVWLKNPIPYLESHNADVAFMDDGARTPRYTPFFVNSGFYYLKYNAKSLYFQEQMLKSGPSEIGTTHSHQSVLIRHLAESHHLYGLTVQLLDRDLFPSGQAYHERKQYIKKIVDRTYEPFVFHMCWTSNRVDKVKYFREIGLWYIPEAEDKSKQYCSDGKTVVLWAGKQERVASKDGKAERLRENCCLRGKYFKLVGE